MRDGRQTQSSVAAALRETVGSDHRSLVVRSSSSLRRWLRGVALVAGCAVVVAASDGRAEDTGSPPGWRDLKPGTLIHGDPDLCTVCHKSSVGGRDDLVAVGDYPEICGCHYEEPGALLHPSDIEPSAELLAAFPEDFPLEDGVMVCVTCHDVTPWCRLEPDRSNLRGAPSMDRSDFCFRCHDIELYKKLNAHDQINEEGRLVTSSCLRCHERMPSRTKSSFKEVRFIGDLDAVCERCHAVGDHPGGRNHKRVPSKARRERMKAMAIEFDAIFPLQPSGTMTCVTCHNPHEKGVIPENRPGARGASSPKRFRIPKNLCQECHEK